MQNFLIIKTKTINITNEIIIVRVLYKFTWLKEKRPKAIPSFQIRVMFKNFDEKSSLSNALLLRLITYTFEILSKIKIKIGIIKLI